MGCPPPEKQARLQAQAVRQQPLPSAICLGSAKTFGVTDCPAFSTTPPSPPITHSLNYHFHFPADLERQIASCSRAETAQHPRVLVEEVSFLFVFLGEEWLRYPLPRHHIALPEPPFALAKMGRMRGEGMLPVGGQQGRRHLIRSPCSPPCFSRWRHLLHRREHLSWVSAGALVLQRICTHLNVYKKPVVPCRLLLEIISFESP